MLLRLWFTGCMIVFQFPLVKLARILFWNWLECTKLMLTTSLYIYILQHLAITCYVHVSCRYCYFRSLMSEINPRIMCTVWNHSHLDLWHHGDNDALVRKAKYIQDHLQSTIHSDIYFCLLCIFETHTYGTCCVTLAACSPYPGVGF